MIRSMIATFTALLAAGSLLMEPAPAFGQNPAPDSLAASVLAAEDARFAAMVEGDVAKVDRATDDEVVYTHSTGMVEEKDHLLERIATGSLVFLGIDTSDREVRDLGRASVVTGEILVRVGRDDGERVYHDRYVAVYESREGCWVLVAWQSTALPD